MKPLHRNLILTTKGHIHGRYRLCFVVRQIPNSNYNCETLGIDMKVGNPSKHVIRDHFIYSTGASRTTSIKLSADVARYTQEFSVGEKKYQFGNVVLGGVTGGVYANIFSPISSRKQEAKVGTMLSHLEIIEVG